MHNKFLSALSYEPVIYEMKDDFTKGLAEFFIGQCYLLCLVGQRYLLCTHQGSCL